MVGRGVAEVGRYLGDTYCARAVMQPPSTVSFRHQDSGRASGIAGRFEGIFFYH